MAAALKRLDDPMRTAPVAAPAPARTLLRFITCGSVDDGKSTLLGRLLYETGSVFEDQLEALEKDTSKFGTNGKELDFALLLDGLSAEREQGITIDVAYRYFSTPSRAFIAADTPGHEQYTRNMATGASTADVAIILVDARKGLLAQTRRHSYIVAMLGVRQVIVAVNKMDLVGYSEETFRAIERDYGALAASLGFAETHIVPLSARMGDNVAALSSAMPWYRRPSLLALLETIEPLTRAGGSFRFPVQWVNRPNLDFRGYAGTIASGEVRVGDRLTVLPRGQFSTVARILGPAGDETVAIAGQSITLTLADEIDISRGDVLVSDFPRDQAARVLDVRLLALNAQALTPGRSYLARLGTATTAVRIAGIDHQIDVHDYRPRPANELAMNAIGVATLRFEAPVFATRYQDCRALGALLLIDPVSNETVGLGVVERVGEPGGEARPVPGLERLKAGLVSAGLLSPQADRNGLRRYLSWRALSALAFGLIVGVLTGSPAGAAAAMAADLILRPLARIGHDLVWSKISERLQARDEAALTIDGGGI